MEAEVRQKLIDRGKAFVCDLTADEVRASVSTTSTSAICRRSLPAGSPPSPAESYYLNAYG